MLPYMAQTCAQLPYMAQTCPQNISYRGCYDVSSIEKRGSGPGGALELHPLRHQDIIYRLHALVMYLKSVDQRLLAFKENFAV
jgi:hypothetical protein